MTCEIHLNLYKNKITKSSILEYLLLKVKINYTQYFAKNPIGIIRLKTTFHNVFHVKGSFPYLGPQIWNMLRVEMKKLTVISALKCEVKEVRKLPIYAM